MRTKWLFHVIQGVLALAFLMSGASKLLSNADQIREMYTEPLGYAPSFMYGIGALEIIAALGLIVGFRWRRLAAGSALELAVILIDVIVSHLAANAAADAVLPTVYLTLLAALLYQLFGKESVWKQKKLPVGTSRT